MAKKKGSPVRKTILIIAIVFMVFLLLILGLVVWSQTANGHKIITNYVQNKPQSSWQAKFYYGLYKSYPPVTTNTNNETENLYYFKDTRITTSIDATADKELYRSGDTVNVTLNVKSDEDIKNATLYIYGIKNKYNNFAVSEQKTVNLVKDGQNNFYYSLKLPYCNSCSGVKEGDYLLSVKIISNQTLIGNTEFKISLKQ